MGNFDRTRWFYSVFKMDVTIWLSVLLAVITLGTPASSSEPRVVCYYTNWSVYRPGTARFNPQNINPYLCTHLIYAFGGFTKDNALKPFDKYQDIEKGGFAKFTGLKTYNKNLKTMLAIGGWNEGSTRFSPMVAARDRRKEFVRNAIKFLRQNRFDGLDLDWEYPAFRDGGKPKDRENYAKLVKELREEFERESQKTGKPRLLLTMAVPAGIEYIQKGFDVKTLNQYLDWMNLLTYDYHSAFEPAVNHHAPLYPIEEPNEYSVDNELNIDYTIKFYLEQGADADKLVLGIPTYGRSYTLFNPEATEIGAPADGPGEQGDATREKGYLAYYEICEALKPKSKKRNTDSNEYSEEEDDDQDDIPWSVVHPNENAMGPVAYKGNQWVGYDDEGIVRRKAEYVAENNLGGIMFWSIDNDDFRGTCHGKPYPLIEAAKESYLSKIGSTSTVIRKSQTSPSRSSSKRKSRPKSTTTTTTTQRPTTNKRTSTTPSWSVNTPEPPTTPDPGSDFKCVDEGFYPHPRDCKKYFWCLDSGPSNLGIVAHQFTCPSGLYFNKAADSCDFSRNVLCKISTTSTKATTKASTTTTTTSTTTTTTTPRPVLTTRNSAAFRTTLRTTTREPEHEYEYTEEEEEDPRVIKELIDLIKKVGGIEQLEKQLHLDISGANSKSTDGSAITTTPSSFNKKLYQKVLDRTRGKAKHTGTGSTSIFESLAQSAQKNTQNSRRGPQNEGLEPASDRNTLVNRDRPQYVTINRQRAITSTTPVYSESEEAVDEEEEEDHIAVRAKSVETRPSVATTAKPLQYVNIRRGRPTTASTSDTADDTASRNALFERQEPLVAVSDSPNTLNFASLRPDNIPEYVTIRRQRPTTEEPTTAQYSEVDEKQEDIALEREISAQPKYNSIVRTRSTLPPEDTTPKSESTSPDPSANLPIQISSLLNSQEVEDETEKIEPTTEEPTTTTTTPSTTTSTTTRAPSLPPRRTNIIRRRGSPTSTAAPSTTAQVSPRNYTTVRRRRPLPRQNEISSDSDDSNDLSRKIRSTTPDSREVDGVTETGVRRFRSRFQTSQARSDDSVAAAASPVSRGQFRPDSISEDEVISLTPIDVEPQFVPRQSFSSRTERRFRRPVTAAVTAPETAPDSEVSAATVEARRPNLLPRGRSRFTLSSTTDATVQASTTATYTQRRPTFARFSPRPFTRASPSPALIEVDEEITEEPVTQRIAPRLPFGRTRPTLASARKLPFPSRQSTTQQSLVSSVDNDDDGDDDEEPEIRADDILLSESARAEKEHDEPEAEVEEAPKRRIVIKKLRAPGAAEGDIVSTETIPVDDSGKKRFRVIRRRPTTTTTIPEPEVASEAPTAPGPQRFRKIIRKKIKLVENEPEIIAKSIDSLNTFRSSTTEVFNYGEKTKAPPTITSTEAEIEPIIEEVTEFYKEERKVNIEALNRELGSRVEQAIQEEVTEKIIETVEENLEEKIVLETTVAPTITESISELKAENVENVKVKSETITEIKSDGGQSSQSESKPEEEVRESISVSEVNVNNESGSIAQTEAKVEVAIATAEKGIDITETQQTSDIEPAVTETDAAITETTTPSTTTTTESTSAAGRARLPYRPRKKIFTPSTEASLPSSSKTFSRKFNPGVYTSPASVDRPQFKPSGVVTRRPFSSKVFTRRPFTPRTTQRVEDDEEYNDEEILEGDEPEQDNPFVFVPSNQLFTRKPDSVEEDDTANSEELLEEGEIDEEEDQDEQGPVKVATTRRPGFRPRVVNSNTFRTSTSTTEIPRRFGSSQNRTGIVTRFGANKPVVDNKKRVQNVPSGYNSPVNALKAKGTLLSKSETTTAASITESDTTTEDDYLTVTSTAVSDENAFTTSDDASTTNTMETETATEELDIDYSTDDYLEYTEGTTNYPSTQESTTFTQTELDFKTTFIQNTATNTETTTEQLTTTTTTTAAPTVAPIIKTQFNKLFSVSRVVEVNSKLDKHRLNKNNETTLIEEGKLMVEKKPVVDKIGEVSRYSLIKIVEDEIPIYLTKFGHVYPVEHPPDNIIRIDEARNARALNENFSDAPRENLVASESVNEAYRHVKEVTDSKDQGHIEHVPNDHFLSYINDEKKNEKELDSPLFAQWQFVPAAYENEKVRAGKSYDIVTPRSMLTNPSTLSLEGLFKTENPIMARKVNEDKNQPFVVYSASVPSQQEDANIVKLSVLKPETGRSIITFAKGQEFTGGLVKEETTVKYPINVSVYPKTDISSTLSVPSTTFNPISSTTASTTTTESPSSPILDLLSTAIVSTTDVTPTTIAEATTTESVTEEATTVKISPLDAKRAKFGFPRRPIIKSSNFTRPSVVPRTVKRINATAVSNSNQKLNKTTFSPTKTRFSANRVQNVPVDLKKKSNSPKVAIKSFVTTKTYTTEAPKTTTERKLYFKPIRPNFRPGFIQRKTTPSATTGDT